MRIFFQRRHRAAHALHAEHQYRKSQHNVSDIFVSAFLGDHFEQDTNNGNYRRDRRRGQKLRDPVGAFYVGQTEYPPSDTGTDIRPHDDTDRLRHLHHARVDETDDHDRRRRRRLYDRSDRCSQEHTLDRCVRQLIQYQLQFFTCRLFQPVSHQGHAKQEKSYSAK